ncbi:MAG: hypothetical protein KAU14_03640, partial [Thermoplasmata archaeon]|nr:hypothetical protein [Thermoplasmata archaeon]
EVLTKPGIFIDHPIGGEIVNGTYPISGRAEHDCNNTIQEIELWIDGNKLTVTDTTPTPGIVLWGFNWNTTLYDPGTGKDKYPNGPHNIGVRCRNSNPSGYDTSDWCNITVTVVNVPVLHFQHPEEGEFVDQTEGLPLYKVEVKVESFHDLTGVKLRIDNGPSQGMTLMGNTFSYMLDTSKYGDGYHTLRYVGEYGYGEVSEAVTILLDSPNEDSLPTISASYELTDNGLTVQGTSSDDFMVEWVKLRLDDNPWIIVNQSGENFTRFDHFWSREALTPDTHSISIKAYDGFDSEDKIIWVPVGLLYDLTIKEIILPTDVTEDDWVNFTVVVENTGPYASPPVNLILRIGRIMRTEDGITIPANSRQDIEISWHASKGNHSISAEINPSQKNDETDPTNNVYTDGNLKVKEKKADGPSDGFDYSMIMIAAVIMIILGIAAGVSFLFGGKKKVE